MALVAHRGGTAQFDLAQSKGERHGSKRDQHQSPEGVHICQERRLRLDLLPDPVDGLLVRLGE